MKFVILNLIASLALVGCTSYPSKMKMSASSMEVIDYDDVDYFRVNFDDQGFTDIAAPTIRLHIKSEAFSYIYQNEIPFYFLCKLMNNSAELSDTEFGRVYYRQNSGRLAKAPYYFDGKPQFEDFYVYMFRSLKASSEVSKHDDIDLLDAQYSDIECKIVSPVFVLGFPKASNAIKLSKSDISSAFKAYQSKPKRHNVMSLEEYERKVSNK